MTRQNMSRQSSKTKSFSMSNLNAIEEGKVDPKDNRKSVDLLAEGHGAGLVPEFQSSLPASASQIHFANEILTDIKADGASFWDTNLQIDI